MVLIEWARETRTTRTSKMIRALCWGELNDGVVRRLKPFHKPAAPGKQRLGTAATAQRIGEQGFALREHALLQLLVLMLLAMLLLARREEPPILRSEVEGARIG